jgi:hypothetical protein
MVSIIQLLNISWPLRPAAGRIKVDEDANLIAAF